MKMYISTACCMLLLVVVGHANGRLQDLVITQPMYENAVVEVVKAEYALLQKDVDALLPIMEKCSEKMNTTSDACESCLQTVDCSGGLSVLDIMRLASPADFLKERNNRIAAHLKVIAKTVAEQTVKGSKAVAGGLRAGLKVSISGLKASASAAGKGVKAVVKGVGKAVKAVKAIKNIIRGIKGIFGRRRRSTLTPDEQSCLAKCPDCKPFTSGDETAAYREVCGADVVDRNATIAAVADYIDSFFDDFTEAKEDLLKQIQVNTGSELLTKVTALVQGEYRSFSTNVKFEAFDPALMYKNLATYIFKNYLTL